MSRRFSCQTSPAVPRTAAPWTTSTALSTRTATASVAATSVVPSSTLATDNGRHKVLNLLRLLRLGWPHDPGDGRGAYWAEQPRRAHGRQGTATITTSIIGRRALSITHRIDGRRRARRRGSVRCRHEVDELHIGSCLRNEFCDFPFRQDALGNNNEAREMDLVHHSAEVQFQLPEQTSPEPPRPKIAALEAGEVDSILPDGDARTGGDIGASRLFELFLVRIVVVVDQVQGELDVHERALIHRGRDGKLPAQDLDHALCKTETEASAGHERIGLGKRAEHLLFQELGRHCKESDPGLAYGGQIPPRLLQNLRATHFHVHYP